MTNAVKERITHELDDFPEEKIDSLLDYIHFLKIENQIKIPNKITAQAMKDTEEGKNLNTYSSLDDFFQKMGV